MSIATKTGDDGTTGLIFGHRVPKFHLRVEACGALDELNAALGLARSSAADKFIVENILWVQQTLVNVMGEVGVLPQDLPRYRKAGFKTVTRKWTAKLDGIVKKLEAEKISFKGWATPGATPHAAALDVARTICRRAERRVAELRAAGELSNGEILIFLNRLSDVLWLLARKAETAPIQVAKTQAC